LDGLKAWFVARKIKPENVIELDWWESHPFNQDILATRSIPIHWATFQLTQEPFLEPAELLISEVQKAGVAPNDFNIIWRTSSYSELKRTDFCT
jgi:L-ascorbate metabolism protein UlaG (beta-lactamase superfamily)